MTVQDRAMLPGPRGYSRGTTGRGRLCLPLTLNQGPQGNQRGSVTPILFCVTSLRNREWPNGAHPHRQLDRAVKPMRLQPGLGPRPHVPHALRGKW